jgi:cytochrome c oxidase assembly protein subunit 15
MGGLFILGGLQGGLGWVMVASGLKDQPWVSPYRLAAHLGLAVLLYGALVLTALRASGYGARGCGAKGVRRSGYGRACLGSAGLVFVTILSGAFVAGLDAGFTYNTFPLMDGRWIPAGWASLSPWWRNLFETIPAVQFNHRLLAMITACWLLVLALWGGRRAVSPLQRRLALAVGVMVCIQVALGITTLLLVVPVGLGVAHQGGALILWSLVLALGAQADSDLGKVESA